MSIINYKFKSSKNFSSIKFEGNFMNLWELKYEIINLKKMNSKDFDLQFYDADANEKIEDEYSKIMGNTNIIIHRIPAHLNTKNIKKAKEVPENYVCFRCGGKNHYIQNCPTIEDKNYEINKIKAPSGIPKEFLEKTVKEAKNKDNVMYDGNYVLVRPQLQEWRKQSNIARNIKKIPNYFKCNECRGLLVKPHVTSCSHYYCEGCAYVDERCVRCRKIITSLNYDKGLEEEIRERYNKK